MEKYIGKFLVNWLEEAEVLATQILWKIAATLLLCTHGSEIVKSAVKNVN